MWTDVSIAGRSARVFDAVDRPQFVLLFLPDTDGVGPVDSPDWAELFTRDRWSCVSFVADDPWWSSKGANSGERYFLDECIPWVKARYPSTSLALLGIGAGGQAALRFGFKYPKQFRAIASLAGSIDHYELHGRGTTLDELYPTREHCRQDGAIMHVHPANWPPYIFFACPQESPWLRGNDRLHEKLQALGVPHRTDFTTPVCGHTWTYYDHLAPSALKFLAEGLQKESRRLM